jgi:hypothetical protein
MNTELIVKGQPDHAGAEPDPHAVRTLLARRRKVRSHRGPVTSQHAKHQTPNTKHDDGLLRA